MEPLNDRDIQLLEDFENGRLTLGNQQIVQKRLEEDMDFRKLHNDLKQLIPIITDHFATEKKQMDSTVKKFLMELEESLPEVTEDMPTNNANLKQVELPWHIFKEKIVTLFQSKYLTLVAAASITLLIVIGAFIYNRTERASSLALFYEKFVPYRNVDKTQKMGENNSDDFYKAYNAYEGESYEEAIDQFEVILKKQQDSHVLFYLGNAHLACHNAQKAIDEFKLLLKTDPDFYLSDQVHWYLALSYLHQNDKKSTLQELSLLKHKENISKANDIIRQLK